MTKFTNHNKLKHGDIVNVYNAENELIYENARISVEDSNVYIVHDNESAMGGKPRMTRNRLGYRYGYWTGMTNSKGIFSNIAYRFKFKLLENNKYRENDQVHKI